MTDPVPEREPAENLGTDQLLEGQDTTGTLPEREPVENLGLDKLLGVDGQLADAEPEAPEGPDETEPAATRKRTR